MFSHVDNIHTTFKSTLMFPIIHFLLSSSNKRNYFNQRSPSGGHGDPRPLVVVFPRPLDQDARLLALEIVRHKIDVPDMDRVSFVALPDLYRNVRDPLGLRKSFPPSFFSKDMYSALGCPGQKAVERKKDYPGLMAAAVASLAADQEDGGLADGHGVRGCGRFVLRAGSAQGCKEAVAEVMRGLLQQ